MDDGKLSEAQKKIAIDWVNAKAPRLVCPACGSRSFALGEHLVHNPIFAGGSVILGGTAYPQFFLSCNQCSNMLSFSAVASGVLPREGSNGS